MTTTALIHVARRDLALDDETYRALLARITGHSSVRDMDERQRQAVLTEMKRLGFKPRSTKSPTRPSSPKAYVRLIHALWRSCHELGEVESGSRESLRAFAKRFVAHGQASVAVDPDLLSYDQARPIIEALKDMEARGKAKALRAIAEEHGPDDAGEDGA